jgi:hypothetical protein
MTKARCYEFDAHRAAKKLNNHERQSQYEHGTGVTLFDFFNGKPDLGRALETTRLVVSKGNSR